MAATKDDDAAATTLRPNVLLLIIDDLRPDLGAYGHRTARTPHIDALAARSTLFARAHASVANCAPSRSSLLTGMRPDRHGVMDLVTHLRDTVPNVVTLPQRFREAGYLSVGYGKIFHQNLDDALSWSSQAEFPDGNHSYRGLRGGAWVRAGGWRRGWRYDQYRLPDNLKAQRTRDTRAQPLYSVVPPYESGPTDDPRGRGTTDAHIASSAIGALRRLRAQPKPWFLAVGFVRPHLPFNAPAAFFAAAAPPPHVAPPRPPAGLSHLTRAHLGGGNGELWSFKGAKQLTQRDPRQLRRAYAACVSFVDSQVGRVLSALGSGALAQRTVVALLSDHGWKLAHYGAWGKHTLLAADTHVPLLLHAPWLPASHGRSVDLPVELLDLYPSLLELANLPPPPTLTRHSRTHTRKRKAPHSHTASGRRLGRGDNQGRRLAPDFRSPGSHLAARARSRSIGSTIGNMTAAPRRAPPPQLDGRSLLPLLSGGGEGGGTAAKTAAARAAARRVAAFALSQWGDHRSEGCMGYALRVPGWTLVQWVLSPQHRSAGSLAGGSEAARRAARRRAPSEVQAVDAARCAASADLFRLPLNGSTDETERRSTTDFPRTTRRLRVLLRAQLHLPGWVLPAHRVTRGENIRGETRGEAEGEGRSQGTRRRSRAAMNGPGEPGGRPEVPEKRHAARGTDGRTRHGKQRGEKKVQILKVRGQEGRRTGPRGQKGLRGKRRCVYGTVSSVPCD